MHLADAMSKHAAALAELFSKAHLSLRFPTPKNTSVQPSECKSTVLFDELLDIEVLLALPSDSLFPVPTGPDKATDASFTLPLRETLVQPHSNLVPPHLNALLSCLHVNLLTDYVPQSIDASAPVNKSPHLLEPLATVQRRFAHLQLLPSPSSQSHLPPRDLQASVRAFSNAWAGNQPPTFHPHAGPSVHEASSKPQPSVLEHDAQQWSTRWRCHVPINFIATPFEPLLSVTAALTLRLEQTLLDHLIPDSDSHSDVRLGFSHSLLTPFHEGPIYPDESPLQSQARALASSALGLDGPHGLGSYLAHLPKDVVGGSSSIVTPRFGMQRIDAIHQRSQDALPAGEAASVSNQNTLPQHNSNSDLAALSTSSSASTSASSARPQTPLSEQPEEARLQIYKRSTREILSTLR